MLGDYSLQRKYADEWQIMGISVRRHVMAMHREALAGAVDIDSRKLPMCIGRRVRIAGVLEAQRRAHTRDDRVMRFLTLEDEFGLFEVTVFPGACRTSQRTLNHYGPYIVAGRIEDQYDTITVSADSISLHKSKAQRLAS